MKRIENRENNDCWESQVFAGIKVGALRKGVEDILWLMIMLWEPENCVMLVLKLAEREQGHLGTNSPRVEFARSHSDFSWFSVCSQLCAFAPCALGSSRSWKILSEKLYKLKRNEEFWKLLPSQRSKTDLANKTCFCLEKGTAVSDMVPCENVVLCSMLYMPFPKCAYFVAKSQSTSVYFV